MKTPAYLTSRTPALLAGLTAGLAVLGVFAVRRDRSRARHRRKGRSDLMANARRALASRRAVESAPPYPGSTTAHEGMRPLPNTAVAPSGALNAEGHRPVLERSRKVR